MGSNLSLLVSAIMLFATLVYYYKMVLLSEQTAEASLFNTLYAEYATPQMMDALRAVEEFTHGGGLAPEQVACLGDSEPLWDRAFDHDWQRLLHWYRKVVYFHRMGLLNDRFAREFPGQLRTRAFVQHVEPFALYACRRFEDNENCSEVFDYLRALYALPGPSPALACEGDVQQPEASSDATKEEL